MIDRMMDVAGLKLKLAQFSLQFIQLAMLFAHIPFNSRRHMPHCRKLACSKPFRMLVKLGDKLCNFFLYLLDFALHMPDLLLGIG